MKHERFMRIIIDTQLSGVFGVYSELTTVGHLRVAGDSFLKKKHALLGHDGFF